jgi:hypothetical protein
MQVRGQFSDFFFETMLPALSAKIWQTYRAKKPMCPQLLDQQTTSRSIEQYSQMAGVGLPIKVEEGEDTPTDSFVQGFDKTYKPVKFGLGIAASQELVEDDKFGIISKRAVALSESIYYARELQAASVYNNAFDGVNFAGPDGKALCAIDHPLIKAGGVQSNSMAIPADLDVASLEIGLTDWELIKDHRGFLQLLSKPRLLVAAANRWNAMEITKSNMRSDTANNTTNAFQYGENGGAIDPLIWAQLTDPDAWFLVAQPSECEQIWLDRKAPYTSNDFNAKNETGVVYMKYRSTVGFHGWRGIYGSPGA